MKKTDIAMIILIASLSVLTAYFIAKATPLGSTDDKAVTVKTVDAITPEVTDPDPTVFNKNAINPTVEVLIGGSVDVSALSQ